MTSLNRITKFVWLLSLLAFLAFDLYTYSQLPQSVGYMYNGDGLPEAFVPRPVFFFIAIAFILLLNLIMVALIKTFIGFPFRLIGWDKLAAWQTTRSLKQEFSNFIETWGYSFLIFLNLFLLNTLYVLWKVNVEIGSRISEHSWIIWPFVFLLITFPIYLVSKLSLTPNKIQSKK
jgi:uncharacterized membrane protein